MAVVIHHGGSGTTAFAIRSGVPSYAVPFVFDQFFWGKRIAALGVGPKPIAFKKLTVSALSNAIRLAISDPQMGQKAANLGERISSENGIAIASGIIEDLLHS